MAKLGMLLQCVSQEKGHVLKTDIDTAARLPPNSRTLIIKGLAVRSMKLFKVLLPVKS